MTSSTARLLRHDTPPAHPAASREARPAVAAPGPSPGARGPRPGTLRLVLAASPAAPVSLPREAVRVAAFRAVLEVTGGGARRGTGEVLSRRASDRDLGLHARRALDRPDAAEPAARPQARPFELIHPGRAFCDGTWMRPRRPVRLARLAGRGPLSDGTRSVSLERVGDAIRLAPRARRGLVAGLAALVVTASDEELGAAVRRALRRSR